MIIFLNCFQISSFILYISKILLYHHQKKQQVIKILLQIISSFARQLFCIFDDKYINKMYKNNVEDAKQIQRNYAEIMNTTIPVHKSYNKHNKTQNNHMPICSSNPTQEEDIIAKTINQTVAIRKSRQKGQTNLQKMRNTTDRIYQTKKSAYKNYIRQIYSKINEEIKKKNTFLTIAAQKIKQVDYTISLTAKQFKPIRLEQAAKNKIKECFRSQRLPQSTEPDQRAKHLEKVKSTNQSNQQFYKPNHTEKEKEKIKLSRTQRQPPKEKDIDKQKPATKRDLNKGQLKQRIYSLSSTVNQNKIKIQDFMPFAKILNRREPFVCGLSEKQGTQEKNRLRMLQYVDFLWKINYSNGIYVKPSNNQETVYSAFIGGGNNSIMIKSILKRRSWWNLSDKPGGCNFVWTQLKQNMIFKQLQLPSTTRKEAIYNLALVEVDSILAQNARCNEDEGSHTKIFNAIDSYSWLEHMARNTKTEIILNERTFSKRIALLTRKNIHRIEDSKKTIIHNHLESNFFIGNKKALYYNMKRYYRLCRMNIFDALPLTFHISKGTDDQQYKNFINYYNQLEECRKRGEDQKNIWILKPGQFSNRGNGISVCHSLDDIHLRLKSKERSSDGSLRTFIVQKYIQKPLLYNSRKFDIRHYLLVTCFNGIIKAYWYPEGYIRTASSLFSLKKSKNIYIHLTNDAVQKHSDQYGKYEKGNKISYNKFQKYLDKNLKNECQKNIFYESILPQMKQLTVNAVKATYLTLDQKRKQHNFELLGMDFMIDHSFKPWLLEINTNPCYQLSCPLLSRLIPNLIENTFRLCVDPFFPPPENCPAVKKDFLDGNALDQNKFQLIFDESIEGKEIEVLYNGNFQLENTSIGKIQEDAQVYENDGFEQWEGKQISEIL